MVATGLPLVIYMGVSRCESIQRDLLDAKMPASMPIAVIQNATRRNQRSIITTLAALVADLHASGIGSPAIMVVGETVRHAQIDATMRSESISHQRETQSKKSMTGELFGAKSRWTPRQC